MNRAAIIAEMNRQSQIFYDAINTATKTMANHLGQPSIEALANAIGTFAGATLAATPAGPNRDGLRDYIIRQMEASLEKHDGAVTQCQVVKLGQLQ